MNQSTRTPAAIRAWLNRHPVAGAGLATTLLAVCLVYFVLNATATMGGPSKCYYFDLASGRLFTAPSGQLLPIASPSSDAAVTSDLPSGGVRAYVFTCGDCGDRKSRFIGYLQTHNPRTLERMSRGGHGGHSTSTALKLLYLQESADGLLIRAFNSDANQAEGDWVPERSPQGASVYQSVSMRCGDGGRIERCEP